VPLEKAAGKTSIVVEVLLTDWLFLSNPYLRIECHL